LTQDLLPVSQSSRRRRFFLPEGEITLEDVTLSKGDYLYTPQALKHSVCTIAGCILLLVIQEEYEAIFFYGSAYGSYKHLQVWMISLDASFKHPSTLLKLPPAWYN